VDPPAAPPAAKAEPGRNVSSRPRPPVSRGCSLWVSISGLVAEIMAASLCAVLRVGLLAADPDRQYARNRMAPDGLDVCEKLARKPQGHPWRAAASGVVYGAMLAVIVAPLDRALGPDGMQRLGMIMTIAIGLYVACGGCWR